MERLLHEQRGGVLDLLHRLLGDGGEGSFLRLGSHECEAIDLAGRVRTDHTDVGLHFSGSRVGREVTAGREGRSSRTASHDVEEDVVTAPAHIAGTTSAALLKLREQRGHEVLDLLTELRIDVLQKTGKLGI